MMLMPLLKALEEALAEFIAAFDSGDLAWDVGPTLTCGEAEAVAGLLRALCLAQAAENWIEGHAQSDDCGDDHCRCGGDRCAHSESE